MKFFTTLAALFSLALSVQPVLAHTITSTPPPRDTSSIIIPPTDPDLILQGGDTWDDAFAITEVPYFTTGTNVGYSVNCCMQMCPYEAWGPAVFYTITPVDDIVVQIDLCGSDYDTGLYVYDLDHHVVACNIDFYFDDECGVYVSKVEEVVLTGMQTYYIVVTGMSGSSGNYIFDMTEDFIATECILDTANTTSEGEPSLVYQYIDNFNGGCNSPDPSHPMQELAGDANGQLNFSGISGWYHTYSDPRRDTDWFTAEIGSAGIIEVVFSPEVDSILAEIIPGDCYSVELNQIISVESCSEGSLQVSGDPGSVIWLAVQPSNLSQPFYHPDNEFDYLLTLDGLQEGTVATTKRSWDSIRAVYR